jgi:integrase
MVSYQLGHSDISTTANLYGKFVPEHFKVGFEAAINERKELVEWLEGGYFS